MAGRSKRVLPLNSQAINKAPPLDGKQTEYRIEAERGLVLVVSAEGVGSYYFEDARLARWRKLVAADKTGREIARVVATLRKRGYTIGAYHDYKKLPKPFAPDHPRADLLKKRGLTCAFPAMPRGLLHEPALADWLVDHAKATSPLVKWLYRHVK